MAICKWCVAGVCRVRKKSTYASSREDEGGPLGIGFQEQVSNPLKRLSLREVVVSVEEKSKENSAGTVQKDEGK